MALKCDTSSHYALQVFHVSLKYLFRFFSYRADTKLYMENNQREITPKICKDMQARVL